MFCPKCNTQNLDQAQFCAKCGSPLTLTTPAVEIVTPSNQSQPAIVQTPNSSEFHYQGVGKRLVAVLIDSVGFFVIFGFIISLLTGQASSEGFHLTGLPAFLVFFLLFVYFVVMEGLFGATLGKMLLKMKVVKTDGSPCDIASALTRNVLRIVDYFFFGFVGMILIWMSPKKQRLGDTIANTIVVGK